MSTSSIIIIFLILAVASLLMVSFANQKETKQRIIMQRIHALKRRIIELEDIATGIEPLLENLMVAKLVNDEITSIADTILRLDPNALYAIPIKDATITFSEELSKGNRSHPLNRALSSDAAIAKHQHYLKEAALILRKQEAIGKFGADQLDNYIHELNWATLMIEVISMIAQGHVSIDKSSILKANSYYQRAQQLVSSATYISDPRCAQFIQELSEILDNKRKTLSTSIMPEVHLNPKNNPHALAEIKNKSQTTRT